MTTSNTQKKPNWLIVGVFVVGACFGAVSAVQIVPNYSASVEPAASGVQIVQEAAGDAPPNAQAGAPSGAAASSGAVAQLPPPKVGLECVRGRNGGATDQGVTADSIDMATTVAESGIGAAFLGEVRYGIQAVADQVNRAGGICGRKLNIRYIDDGWNAQTGAQFIRNFLSNVFAIPVGPSSEGLRVEISNGDIDRSGVPVVGADGLLIEEYVRKNGAAQPWVWPVAAATVASARAMVDNAFAGGARSFGIVFDKDYRFGVEAAAAFNSEVRRLTGKPINGYNADNNCEKRFCGIQAGQSSYSNQVIEYYKQKVDFTALFLEPQTALVWMADPNTPSARTVKYAGAQPLFTRNFAQNCQDKCDQMILWTGFKPYIEVYKQDPAVRAFVSDLQRSNPQADIYNQFTEGGYLGMKVFVEALKRVGPDVTRTRLKAALDSLAIPSQLAFEPKFKWRSNWRWINATLQSFTIQYKGTFGGWRAGSTQRDPHPAAGTS